MGIINVIKPGMYTTIQDLGRHGFQGVGVPVSGAMDQFSLRTANMLVGNRDDEACFEVTLLGPEFKFDNDGLIAVTGGNLEPRINGRDIKMWSSVEVNKGDVLSFGGLKDGCRSYIAVAGGIDVPVIMGSKSTYVRGNIGGFQGRPLKSGDIIKTGTAVNRKAVKIPDELIPQYKNEITVRVVLGPQDHYFTEEGINTFLTSEYEVTNESDRMGYRLAGPKIAHKNGADIISDGITMGAVQVPAHGCPIILMADRQTTGGYTKIGGIISSDLDYLGQLKIGDKIKFKSISIEEANKIYREYMEKFKIIKQYIDKYPLNVISSNTYKIRINSKVFMVTIKEIEK